MARVHNVLLVVAVEHAMFKFDDLKVNSHYDRQNEKHKVRTLVALKDGHVACIQTLMTSETMIKSAGTIEQKGVAQLLQIEEVQLKSSRRCGFSQ